MSSPSQSEGGSSLSSVLSLAPPGSPRPVAGSDDEDDDELPAHAARAYSTSHPYRCRSCDLYFETVGTRSHHQSNTHVLATVTVKPGLVYKVSRDVDCGLQCPVCDKTFTGAYYFPLHVLTTCNLAKHWPVVLPTSWTLLQDMSAPQAAAASSSITRSSGKRTTRFSQATAAAQAWGSSNASSSSTTGSAVVVPQAKAQADDDDDGGSHSRPPKQFKPTTTAYGRTVRAPKPFYATPTMDSTSAAAAAAKAKAKEAGRAAAAPSDTVQMLDPTKLIGLPLLLPASLGPKQSKKAQAHVAALNEIFSGGGGGADGEGVGSGAGSRRSARAGSSRARTSTTTSSSGSGTSGGRGANASEGEEAMSDAMRTGGWLGWLQPGSGPGGSSPSSSA